jgi:hypothetical protein
MAPDSVSKEYPIGTEIPYYKRFGPEYLDLNELGVTDISYAPVAYTKSGNVIPLSKRFDSTSNDIRNPKPMKTNHTADETVTIEGPEDHSLDIERVRTVIDDDMHRVGVVYVTFHFVHNRKHRTHSDDFAPSDNWFPVIEELFDEVTAVYKVTIQPSDRMGKAKRLQENPREHRSTSKQGQYITNLLRENPVLESGASFDESDAAQVDKESRTLSRL